MKRREERGGDTFSCHFGRTVHWGLGPSGHLIRLLSQPEHLPAIWHFHPPDRATHLLEARGPQGSQTPANENATSQVPRAVRQHSVFQVTLQKHLFDFVKRCVSSDDVCWVRTLSQAPGSLNTD